MTEYKGESFLKECGITFRGEEFVIINSLNSFDSSVSKFEESRDYGVCYHFKENQNFQSMESLFHCI